MKQNRITSSLLLICIVLVFQVNAQIKSNINWESILSSKDLVWTKMPQNYYEGPYVGNGLIGTVFFKDTVLPNTIGFEIGRVDVYDHRSAEQIKDKYPWPKVRLPIGKLLLSTVGKIQSVHFRTDLWNAEVTGTIVTDQGSLDIICYTPTDEKIIILKYKATGNEKNCSVAFRPEQGNNARAPLRPMAGKVYEPNPPFTISHMENMEVITQPLLNGDDYATAWDQQKVENGFNSVYITVANKWAENITPFNGSNLLAVAQLKLARKKQESQMQQIHQNWWHHYYQKSFISIPDKRMESFYWVQQYRLASAGRPDQPTIDLMGPWYKPSVWLAMWVNLNVQLAYYTTAITNHADLEEPYFTMIEKYQQQLIQTVPKEFQNDCAAMANPVIFNDLSGTVFLTNDSASKKKMSLIALPWIMQQFYLHYRFTMDEARLRHSIYPLMKRAFNVYLRVMYKSADGKYHLPLSFSDEYGEDVDGSMNLALAKWGFKTLISCAERLNIKDELLPQWKDAIQNLVEYPVDERGIMIGKNVSFNKTHRHYSHLFSIFPLYETNVEENKEMIPLIEKSINNFTSLDGDNCMFKFTGAASLWAALGNGNNALQWLQRSLQILPYHVPTVTANGFYSENGWPTFESPVSATRSLLDMMIQSWGNIIRIFPAMPDAWKDASYHQLRAEGGFEVSATMENGITSWVFIKSNAGESCIVQIKDWKNAISVNNPAVKIKYLGDGRYQINLKRGDSVLLSQKEVKKPVSIEPMMKSENEFHWGLN